MKKVNIEESWQAILQDYFDTEKFTILSEAIKGEYQKNVVYPKAGNIFNAFWLTPFSNVSVVILGQDPYHGEGQAHGLSFSVPDGVRPPPSLVNIYKEIEADLEIKKDFTSGCLESWAKQGVLLLNSVLTVRANTPASHKMFGWEDFTDYVIKQISDHRTGVVFMLWGNFARGKKTLIDESKHLVLEAAHPSPFSAYNGFFGCNHFSKCNEYLDDKAIVW